jgi:hypothetical protein
MRQRRILRGDGTFEDGDLLEGQLGYCRVENCLWIGTKDAKILKIVPNVNDLIADIREKLLSNSTENTEFISGLVSHSTFIENVTQQEFIDKFLTETFITQLTSHEEFITTLIENSEVINTLITQMFEGDTSEEKIKELIADALANSTFIESIINEIDQSKLEYIITQLFDKEEFITVVTEQISNNSEFITNITENISAEQLENLITELFQNSSFYNVLINKITENLDAIDDELLTRSDLENALQSISGEIIRIIEEQFVNNTFIKNVYEEIINNLTGDYITPDDISGLLAGLSGDTDYIYEIINNYTSGNDVTQEELLALIQEQMSGDVTNQFVTNIINNLSGEFVTYADLDAAIQAISGDINTYITEEVVNELKQEVINNITNHTDELIENIFQNEQFITNITQEFLDSETIINEIMSQVAAEIVANNQVLVTEINNHIQDILNDSQEFMNIFNEALNTFITEGYITNIINELTTREEFITKLFNNETFVTELVTNLTTNETFITELVNQEFIDQFINNQFFKEEIVNVMLTQEFTEQFVTQITEIVTHEYIEQITQQLITNEFIEQITSNPEFITNLVTNELFVTELIKNEEFVTNLITNENFVTNLITNLTTNNITLGVTEEKVQEMIDDSLGPIAAMLDVINGENV